MSKKAEWLSGLPASMEKRKTINKVFIPVENDLEKLAYVMCLVKAFKEQNSNVRIGIASNREAIEANKNHYYGAEMFPVAKLNDGYTADVIIATDGFAMGVALGWKMRNKRIPTNQRLILVGSRNEKFAFTALEDRMYLSELYYSEYKTVDESLIEAYKAASSARLNLKKCLFANDKRAYRELFGR